MQNSSFRTSKAYIYIWIIGIVATIFVTLGLIIAFTPWFERNAPVANVPQTFVWNTKMPLKFSITDEVGIKSYKVSVVEQTRQTTLVDVTLEKPVKVLDLNLSYPRDAFIPSSNAVVAIHAKDNSLWNWFSGNDISVNVPLLVDNAPPQVRILSSSQSISKGGVATVIFSAIDDTKVVSTWVETDDGSAFATQPLDINKTYVALVPWNIKMPAFGAKVCAKDFAGNITKMPIGILAKDVLYKNTTIKLTANLVDEKMSHLCQNTPNGAITDPLECFKYVNNTLRAKNEEVIKKVTQRIGTSAVSGFFTEPFLPITKASVVGSFGDHRTFELDGQIISESYHMGIDFASIKEAPISAPNNGVVLFAGDNGIYGNMLVIYHGLGLSTLYGHCSSIAVKEGDVVKKGQIVAHTGSTGLAFGDHLHYGIIVQGVPVRPVEWLDAKWINNNVTLMFKQAKEGK